MTILEIFQTFHFFLFFDTLNNELKAKIRRYRMTPNREDYLKLIFELSGENRLVSNKQILANINVSGASVSEMISKLAKEKLAFHIPYQGVQLTEKGWTLASSLVRKHRLWEVFLMNNLKYSWENIHEEAELLEHATSNTLANKLSLFLNHPEICPHGGVIPKNDETISEKTTTILKNCKIETTIQILRVLDADPLLLKSLKNSGIILNEKYVIQEKNKEEIVLLQEENQQKITIPHRMTNAIFIKLLM
jgi:DtxR family Mn-dependent transcriptional regulator